ncbi:MAG TPA: glycosyltransferase family 39 protein [Candidatus Bathyarchaeia archaeon]|nr:glycosyltransferase family 39 protein [Candidatus Bathyarchaeia archaeon]
MNRPDDDKRPMRAAAGVWIVIAVACAIRVLHVFFTQRHNPLASDLVLDAATYDRWARALAFGGDPGPTTLMQAPVYPWFLSLIYRAFGPSLAAVRIAQALVGTASCGLIMLAARRFFRSNGAAIAAGLLAALYAPLIFYEGVLVPATLIVFLNVLFVVVLFAEERPGRARLLVSGVILGTACAANPPTLLLIPFALLHLHAAGGSAKTAGGGRIPEAPSAREGRDGRALFRFFGDSLVLVLGIVVALAPMTIRNAIRTGEFIPLTTGGGINFYEGNNPGANGFYKVPLYGGASVGATPEEQSANMERIASREAGRPLTQTEISRFWFRAGLAYIRGNPRAWGALVWDKFQFFWNAYERANVENLYFHRRFPGVLRLPLVTFGVIAPLGLLGVFLTRGKWRRLWLLYGITLTYLLTALMFYVLSRYRLPVVAALIPFAASALTELFALARGRRTSELALSLAALAMLAFFSNMTVAKDTPGGIAGYYVRVGNVYIARGDTTRAEGAYRSAFELDPSAPGLRHALDSIRDHAPKAQK